MDFLTDWLTNWLKELLISGIMGNLEGLFDTVNAKVGEIAVQVGTTPAAWNAGVFSLIRQLSETVILPIAGLVLTFVATYELIQMLLEKNNMHEFDVANALSFPLHRGAVLLRHRSAPLWPAPAAARQSVPPAFVHLGRPIRSPFLQCLPTYPRLFPQYPPHRNMLRPSRQQPAFPRPAPPLWLAATPLSPRPWEHGRHPLFSAFLQPASV